MSSGQDGPKGRLFKVIISHQGKVVSACEISAVLPGDAFDHAWARYEAEHGPANTFDTEYETKVHVLDDADGI